MQWEDRLLHEMNRLKNELEQMYIEERVAAINKFKREALEETEALKHKFNMRERQLKDEVWVGNGRFEPKLTRFLF